MTKGLCIYHGNCADGFSAAWAIWKAKGDSFEYYPGVYNNPPPDVTGRDVIIVDFSYKADVLREMAEKANSILILDHHKSAEADLLPLLEEGVIDGIFDMDRSGAMIAWDYFHPCDRPPQLLLHVQDRDLWRFCLKGTREIQACVFSHEYDFDIWDELMLNTETMTLYFEGLAIERKHHKDIKELLKVTKTRMSIAGYDVPVANLPYIMASDAGHLMSENEFFAACYWDTQEGRVFSLRSREEGGLDVSEIAKQYGGGGHKHAAGFRMPIEEAVKLDLSRYYSKQAEA